MSNRVKQQDDCVRVLKEMNFDLVKDLNDDNLSLLHDLLTLPQDEPIRTVIKHDLKMWMQKMFDHKYPPPAVSHYDEERHYGGA
jgi:hypothetical protein